MKKIYVFPENDYPCIPESILNDSASSLVARLKGAFPNIDMDLKLTNMVFEAIFNVDRTVQNYLGGARIPAKELQLFVDVTLEREVMRILSSNLPVAEPVAEEVPTEE